MSSWGPANRVQQLLANAHYNNALEEYSQGSYETAIKLLDNARAISEQGEYYGD